MFGDHTTSRTSRTRRRITGGVQFLAILAMLTSLLSGAFPTPVPVAAAAPGPSAAAITFTVNDTTDLDDDVIGNGACATSTATCTLRAAIREANELAKTSPNETFTINLTAGATYVLTLVNDSETPEDYSLKGDLDIKANVTINGNGATVDGNSSALRDSDNDEQQDRVFQVFATAGDVDSTPIAVEFNNLIVTNGYAYNTPEGCCGPTPSGVVGANGGGILNDDFGGEFINNNGSRAAATTSSLTLRNVTVTRNATGSNSDEGVGGGIFNGFDRTLNVIDSTISANGLTDEEFYYSYGTELGGGIFNVGILTISGTTTFQDNSAGSGGGLYNYGSVVIDGSSFLGNSAIGEGAGGAIGNSGLLTLANSKLIGNSAAVGGGLFSGSEGFYLPLGVSAAAPLDSASATIENTEIANNTALLYGGGIANFGYSYNDVKASDVIGSTLEMRGGSLANNTASGFPYVIGAGGSGGGIANFYGTASLTGVNIVANSAAAYGAGEFRFGAGGGVFNVGVMTIDQSAFTGNFISGTGPGGAIANGYAYRYFIVGPPSIVGDVNAAELGTTLTVTNTTISGNNAPSGGGALYKVDDSVATLVNVTVAGNQNGLLNDLAVSDIPNVRAQESTLTVQNSIVANNAEYNCSGTIVNGGYNIDSAATCAFATANNSLSATDPKLGPLVVNAPGTTSTYALLDGSPAIDRIPAGGAGCTAVDQRGVTRPQGPGCDIGAYESLAGSFNVTIFTSGPGTLSVAPGTYNYPAGSTQSYTATSNASDVAFIGWTVDGTFVGFGNPLDLPVTKNRTVVATFAAIPAFCDVTPSTPGAVAIQQLAARGVIFGSDNPNGPGKCFLPGDTLYRIHVAGMVARAFGWDQEDHGNNFTDKGSVDNDLWRNAGTLAFYNVALGYRDGSYDPIGPVLHAQAVSFVTRAMIRKGYWMLQEDNAAYYTAVPTGSGHRQDAVTYHFYAGNILATNAPTDPWNGPTGYDQSSTRTYFAQVLWQAYSSYFSVNHIP